MITFHNKLFAGLLISLFGVVASLSNCTNNPVLPVNNDSTSHAWNFHKYILGQTNNSVLYDALLINDTLVYVVGEIYTKDSSGNTVFPPYNVGKWNGKEWTFTSLLSNCRIYFPNCGPDTLSFSNGTSIFGTSAGNIWVAAGGLHRFDGTKWAEQPAISGVGNSTALFGNSVGELWAVGDNGFIGYKNQLGVWKKLESGTGLRIYDIYGISEHAKFQLIAVASDLLLNSNRNLIQIDRQGTTPLATTPIAWPITGIWFSYGEKYYTVGGGIYEKNTLDDSSWIGDPTSISKDFIMSIHGNSPNDIFAVGANGEIIHFNGNTWKSFKNEMGLAGGNLSSVVMKGNTMLTVGYHGSHAIVIIGKR